MRFIGITNSTSYHDYIHYSDKTQNAASGSANQNPEQSKTSHQNVYENLRNANSKTQHLVHFSQSPQRHNHSPKEKKTSHQQSKERHRDRRAKTRNNEESSRSLNKYDRSPQQSKTSHQSIYKNQRNTKSTTQNIPQSSQSLNQYDLNRKHINKSHQPINTKGSHSSISLSKEYHKPKQPKSARSKHDRNKTKRNHKTHKTRSEFDSDRELYAGNKRRGHRQRRHKRRHSSDTSDSVDFRTVNEMKFNNIMQSEQLHERSMLRQKQDYEMYPEMPEYFGFQPAIMTMDEIRRENRESNIEFLKSVCRVICHICYFVVTFGSTAGIVFIFFKL